MKKRILVWAFAILTIGFLITVSGRAQDEQPLDQPPPPQQQDQQPQQPSIIGRLSVVQGQVSTMHGDGTGWTTATVNTPIVLGDKLSTADRSRAEVQLDPANLMRMDQKTEAQVADLQATKINIQLAAGLVDYSAMPGTQADVEIDTPNMGVHPLAPGVFRIQVNSDSETSLIVREGEAEVLTNDGSTKVEAGQMIQIHGADHPEYKVDQASGGDDFDRWCSDRDQQLAKMRAEVPPPQAEQQDQPPYVGESDLNGYGQWSDVPDEGWCWTPAVDAGWTPYGYGHWGYMPSWGWTWISLEPWGWAPYHYGSWFSWGGQWHWRPGRFNAGFGERGGFYGGRFGVGMNFSARGFVNGMPGGRPPAFGAHGSFGDARIGFVGSAHTWNGFSHGAVYGRSSFGATRSWQRYASPSPYNGRSAYGGGRTYYGGGYGGGSRPPLQLNRPIMQQRAPGGGYYGGAYDGNRSYGAPAGGYGNRGNAAPAAGHPNTAGGNHAYSAPSGGGHSYGGGGHASGGGSHGGGHR